MGQEISTSHFSDVDFINYRRRLDEETRLLTEWFKDGQFTSTEHIGGFELEAWLVDRDYDPAPVNEQYLQDLNNDLVSPELSRFNVELNGAPVPLQGTGLSSMNTELDSTWRYCREAANRIDADLVIAGILPSIQEDQLVLENMSQMKRYRALNEQVFRQRHGKPLQLDIVGREHLKTTHYDVMLESATTSFQIHLQVSLQHAARYYNASIIASAATVAAAANSPFLFGKDLWDETRIPLFEQAVEVGGFEGAAYGPMRRVSFGSGYARESLLECFLENYQHYPVLLPMDFVGPPEEMNHVRLHNGTIWRWNRPLIGYEADGTPHLRIEHRVVSAGPTVVDDIANAALYFGLVEYFRGMDEAPEHKLDFAQSRDNFYAAARQGLNAIVTWFDGKKASMQHLMLEELIPLARTGLQKLEIDQQDIHYYLGIIEERVRTGQNGAVWQRNSLQKHGYDMRELTAAYAEQQQVGHPVHKWPL